jgi:hypothetical protein
MHVWLNDKKMCSFETYTKMTFIQYNLLIVPSTDK